MKKILFSTGLLGLILSAAVGARAENIQIADNLVLMEAALAPAIARAYVKTYGETPNVERLTLSRRATDYVPGYYNFRYMTVNFTTNGRAAECDLDYSPTAAQSTLTLRNCKIQGGRPVVALNLEKDGVLIHPTNVDPNSLEPGYSKTMSRIPNE